MLHKSQVLKQKSLGGWMDGWMDGRTDRQMPNAKSKVVYVFAKRGFGLKEFFF